MKFNKWIKIKEENQRKFNRLSCFDMDDTIAHSPDKPQNNQDLRGWSGKDWWGSKESLTHPDQGGFYTGGVNHEVVEAFQKAKADPNTKAILLTGRRGIVSQHVRNVLRNNNLFGKRIISDKNDKMKDHFNQNDSIHPKEHEDDSHDEYYNGDHHTEDDFPKVPGKKNKLVPDISTLTHKKYIINKLVTDNGGCETVELWDDRYISEMEQFARQLLKSGLVKNFIIHHVFPNEEGRQATIIHKAVKV